MAGLYLVTGLGGCLLSAAMASPNQMSVGASGAIHGLMAIGLFGELGELAWPPGVKQFFESNGYKKLLGWRIVAFTLALSLMGGLIMPRVDSWAHFGGTVVGFALAAPRAHFVGRCRYVVRVLATIIAFVALLVCLYLLSCPGCWELSGQAVDVLI